MERKIKLIWDFRGASAKQTARHHETHLDSFMEAEGIVGITGHKDLSELHSIAFMIVDESRMPYVRDKLLPHRGQVYSDAPGNAN